MPGLMDWGGGGGMPQHGSKRDGAPQPLPSINPNFNPPANFWQGNQLQIPGAPQGGLAGGMTPQPPPMGGSGMAQGLGGMMGQMGGGQGNPLIAHLLQMLQSQRGGGAGY